MKRQLQVLILVLLTGGAISGSAVAQGKTAKKNPAQHSAKTSSDNASHGASTAPQPAAEAPAPTIALRGGRLLTVSHGVIENGTIVMSNGKITAVGGPGTPIPAGAKVFDEKGMTIYPGLFDSQSYLGLTEISAVRMSNDLGEPSDEIMPDMHTADAFHAETEVIPVTRLNGITNAIVAPDSQDTMPGQMTLIQLAGRDRDEMILDRDISMPIFFTEDQKRKDKFPSTRMGMAEQLRQVFIDAQAYAQKWDAYNKKAAAHAGDKSGKNEKSDAGEPPKRDLKLEALVPYLEGKKPVVIYAEESSDAQVAIKLAQEFNLKVILMGLQHCQNMLDDIAATKLPVILGSIYEEPKAGERYDAVFSLPEELHKRGVKIAFASYDAHNTRNLPYQAGYAVAFGLPWDEALRAITLSPAEIWGVADTLGSLDVGKTANIAVANGDPLDMKTDVKQVFIAGRDIPMVSRQTKLRDEYSK